MSKQDRQGVRTPAQLEQKYAFGELRESNAKQGGQISQLIQTLALFMVSTEEGLGTLLQTVRGCANALVGKVTGNKVILKDVSPLEHTLAVKLLSNAAIDFTAVKVSRCGENGEEETYTPTEDGSVEGVKSIFPVTTLTTDTEGVVIEVTYNRDLNKSK